MRGFQGWLVICLLLFLPVAPTGCHSFPDQTAPSQSSQSSSSSQSLPAINYWKTTPPAHICGQAGYTYLVNEYLGPNCRSCHDVGGAGGVAIAATDPLAAYNAALTLAKNTFLSFCTSNEFCGPGCNLSTQGEVYQGIVQWWSNPTTCPTN